jgi:SAM-dependent methyltransferase
MSADGCYLCRGRDLETVEAVRPPYRVLRCAACDLRFVTPQPPPDSLARAYDAGYYAPWLGGEAARRRALWGRRLRALAGAGATGPLLDVGCGDGAFLAAARAAGFQAQGTEFSPYAAALVRERLGVPVAEGELPDAALPQGAFGTVTLWHSLEHTRDPLAVLRAAHRALRPGGLLVVAVPNAEDRVFRWLYRLARGAPPHLFAPDDRELHLFYFSARSLEAILRRADFGAIRIGADRGQVEPLKRLVDLAGVLVSAVARRPWWGALLAHAVKPR